MALTSDKRRCPALLLSIFVFCLVFPAFVVAGEEDVYAALMRRYDAVNDELKKTLADLEYQTPLPDVPERCLSLRKNAIVTIGGEARFAYTYTSSEMHDPGFEPGKPSTKHVANYGEMHMPTLKLLVDARINKRWRVFFDMNASNTRAFHRYREYENPNRPDDANLTSEYVLKDKTDLINQAYVELMKADHSGFGFLAGKMKLPFGLWDRPNLLAQSFMDAPNLAGSFLGDSARHDRAILPHVSRMADPATAVMINYEMRDIVRFEAAVFEERDNKKITKVRDDGTRELKSESSVPRSWQIGASIMPLDGWELTAHFRNRHNSGRGLSNYLNSPFRWDFRNALVTTGSSDPRWDGDKGQWSSAGTGESFGSTRNEQSFILGLAVNVPGTDLTVRTEYARGWNQGFNRHVKSEGVNVGFSYKLAPRVTLHGQGEWLQVKDGSWMAPDGNGGWARDRRNNHLYRGMVGVEYEVGAGGVVEAGWQYEYWRMKSMRGADGLGPERHINKANMFYIGTRFVF